MEKTYAPARSFKRNGGSPRASAPLGVSRLSREARGIAFPGSPRDQRSRPCTSIPHGAASLVGRPLPMSSIIRTQRPWQREVRGSFVVHADPVREAPLAFALSVAAGLDDHPRWLDSRYLYDDAGSA